MRSPITTHILDVTLGRAASGIGVSLDQQSDRGWSTLAKGTTNADGRIEDLLKPGSRVETGIYRLSFETRDYFKKLGTKTFFPEVTVVFEITDSAAHHHVPLLLSAFGYSTYRGT